MKRNSFSTLASKVLHQINRAIPKKDIILFNSFPPYSDNSFALYEYTVENRPDILRKYKIIWGQDDKGNKIKFAENNTYFVRKKSLKGLWTFFRSKYVISTHGYFPGLKSARNQLQVNLWHGNGYKNSPEKQRNYRGDIHIATGEHYVDVYVRNFFTTRDKVKVVGFPRTDILFHPTNSLRGLYIDKSKYGKILIWMPTYRKSTIGGNFNDGLVSSFGIGSISDDEFRLLNETLVAKNLLLLIKPHPMDSVTLQGRGPWSNIKIFTSDDLSKLGIELYSLLSETDVLFSDYSSVIIDYCLLDKPIVMVLSDMEEYKSSRGFHYDNVEDWFPGPIVSDMNSLIAYLNDMENINMQWLPKRRELAKQFNKYNDGKACERVCNLIFGERKL